MSCEFCDGRYGLVPDLPCDNRDMSVLISTRQTVKGSRLMKVGLYRSGRKNYTSFDVLCAVPIRFCPMCGGELDAQES